MAQQALGVTYYDPVLARRQQQAQQDNTKWAQIMQMLNKFDTDTLLGYGLGKLLSKGIGTWWDNYAERGAKEKPQQGDGAASDGTQEKPGLMPGMAEKLGLNEYAPIGSNPGSLAEYANAAYGLGGWGGGNGNGAYSQAQLNDYLEKNNVPNLGLGRRL